jgi:hypothetical protein
MAVGMVVVMVWARTKKMKGNENKKGERTPNIFANLILGIQ